MKTLSAVYKGNQRLELLEAINLPKETEVLVIIPTDDESEMGLQLREAANATFRKLWDNEADEVWNEYL